MIKTKGRYTTDFILYSRLDREESESISDPVSDLELVKFKSQRGLSGIVWANILVGGLQRLLARPWVGK
tara:strand:- start:1082 stop:1288 length:207 start_codon:yes stop_codon:yes gene_type:complete